MFQKMTSVELEEEMYGGREPVSRKNIEDFRIKGLEEIADDLKEHGGWDGVSKVGSVAFRVDPRHPPLAGHDRAQETRCPSGLWS